MFSGGAFPIRAKIMRKMGDATPGSKWDFRAILRISSHWAYEAL
jgi:hypothetical protein